MTDDYIQEVLDGDTNAFRFIIMEYKNRAYSLAFSIVKDDVTAREVVQTSFIKAYTKLNTFRRDAAFGSWLYRIVVNEAIKAVNNQNKRTVSLDDVPEGCVSSELNEMMQKMTEDEQRYYIKKALERLLPKYSLALRLFYLEELHLDEMVEITGWTISNTKVILHRARKKMKELLTKQFNITKSELY
jgi:RNA polymerase sigma-70 factor (ECF subfamily)